MLGKFDSLISLTVKAFKIDVHAKLNMKPQFTCIILMSDKIMIF